MKPRLLVLTAGFGEGHNAAARGLAAACEIEHGFGSVRVMDLFALAAPRTNALSRRAYLSLINRAPHVWRHLYAWIDRSTFLPRALTFLRAETHLLERTVIDTQPTAICSTYPVYAFLFAKLRRKHPTLPPFFNVVTDSISINSLWWRAACEGWFLPNEDSAAVLLKAGVNAAHVRVTGFPVAPFFSANVDRFAPPDLVRGARPRVLYIINSGTKNAAETARALLQRTSWEITCAVGRDEALRRQLEHLAATRGHPATILGWTDQIPRLLLTHHVLVSKAGGATTQEAIAARCPMIVNQIVPGQEEGNYELLRRHGIGALAETPDAVLASLHQAFREHGRVWQQWRTALSPLARPAAARGIVAQILAYEPPPTPFLKCHAISDTSPRHETRAAEVPSS